MAMALSKPKWQSFVIDGTTDDVENTSPPLGSNVVLRGIGLVPLIVGSTNMAPIWVRIDLRPQDGRAGALIRLAEGWIWHVSVNSESGFDPSLMWQGEMFLPPEGTDIHVRVVNETGTTRQFLLTTLTQQVINP